MGNLGLMKMGIHTTTCIGDIVDCHHGFGDASAEEAKEPETELRSQTETGNFPEYHCVLVLSSYKSLNIPDVKWAIMSEVDEAKAIALDICISNRVRHLNETRSNTSG
jgi:hypothetical protein